MAKEFVVKLSVDSSGAVDGLDKVTEEIVKTEESTKNLKQQLRALQVEMQGLDPDDAKFQELSRQAAELKDRIDDTSQAIRDNAGNAFEGLSNNAATLGGRLMSLDFAGAGQSAKAMGANIKNINMKMLTQEIGGAIKGFASLGKALLANPIFLLVAAIVAIGAAFKSMLDGQREEVDAANKAIDASNARRHEQERKRIAQAGNDEKKLAEIKKQIIADDIRDTEKKIANLVRQQRTAYGISEEQEEELAKLREQLSKQRIDQEVFAIEQINKLNSQRASIEERLLEAGMTARERERRQIEVRYQKEIESIQAVGGTQDDVNKINKLQQIELAQLSLKHAQEDSQRRKENAAKRLAELEEEQKKRREITATQVDEGQKEFNKAVEHHNKTFDLKKEFARKDIELQKSTNILKTTEQEKQDAAERKMETDRLERQKYIAQQSLDISSQTLSGLAALNEVFAGQSKKSQERAFKINKAIQISSAIIDTYKAANSALATYPAPFGAIAAGATIAVGLANVSKIAKTKFDGGTTPPGGTGPGPLASTGAGGVSASPPSFNPLDLRTLQNRPPQTSQTYVLAGQVSNAQDANERIKRLAKLG